MSLHMLQLMLTLLLVYRLIALLKNPVINKRQEKVKIIFAFNHVLWFPPQKKPSLALDGKLTATYTSKEKTRG